MNDPLDLLVDYEQLFVPLRAGETPQAAWRIGPESEKFGVHAQSGAPLAYDGEHGVLRVLTALVNEHGWEPEREAPGGPIISLSRDDTHITLEPGAQLELSGAPCSDVHGICAQMRAHLSELERISEEMNLAWLGVGFHPLARQDELPWVPKQRYAIMREYLPTRGARAHDMMRRTSTVQANFDYSDEEDALRKLRVSLVLAPVINAMFANSPFIEGQVGKHKSERGAVWLEMDPDRSGLLPQLWTKDRLSYRDYIEWALDVPMFLFKRDGKVIPNTGQPFRQFFEQGYQGHRARLSDWKLHLNTLFPEARLKGMLEVRACDSLPADLVCAVPALYAGLLYDAQALAEAEALCRELSYDDVAAARPSLVRDGLGASIGVTPVRALAEEVLEISSGGLSRRRRLSADGDDECIHLARLTSLIEQGHCPADALLEGLDPAAPDLRQQIIQRSRV